MGFSYINSILNYEFVPYTTVGCDVNPAKALVVVEPDKNAAGNCSCPVNVNE